MPQSPISPGSVCKQAAVNLDVNPLVRYPLILMNCVLWVIGIVLIVTGLYAYLGTRATSRPVPSEPVLNIYRWTSSAAG